MQLRTLLLPLALFAAIPASANLQLTASVHATSKPKKGVTLLDEGLGNRRQTLAVTLGNTFFRAEDEESTQIVDFAKRRVYRLDRKQGSVSDRSLFAVIGGRDVELDNRIYLEKVTKEAMVDQAHFELPYQEHELSLRREGMPVTKIDTKTKRGETRFFFRKDELMAWSAETHEATPAERAAFVHFVRHQFGGHPEILAALGRVEGIPKWLRFNQPRWGQSTRIDVTEVRRTPDEAYAPLEGTEKFEDAEFGAVVAAVRASTPQSRRQAKDAIAAEATRAASANNMLAALAGFLEIAMMTGEQPPSGYSELFRADPDVQALLGALNPRSAEEAKTAIETLTRLQLIAQRKAYVLAIFRANHEQNLGDTEAAARDYQAALKGNPLITGVWKDYGKMLLNSYQADAAWHAWDMARLIEPSHSLLEEVTALEARLLKQYPEYF